MATGVELSTRVGPSSMEGNDLVADKVVAGTNARGNGVLVSGGALHERGGSPVVGGALTATLLDFEPDGPFERLAFILTTFGQRGTYEVPGDQFWQPLSGQRAI